LEQNKDRLAEAGITVLIVAQGEPKHIERYCTKLAPSHECLARNDTEAYTLYGLQQAGLKEVASLNALGNLVKTIGKGTRGGEVIGDARMMPGTFLIDGQGRVAYTYYSKDISDHPSIDELVAAAVKIGAQ
jgi:peroxiredoxin